MKQKNKQAITVMSVWLILFAAMFAINAWNFEPIGIIITICFFFPIQLVLGFIMSRLITWSNRGGGSISNKVFPWLARFSRPKKIKGDIECQDQNVEGCTKIAEWACHHAWWFRQDYPADPVSYYCTACMIANLEGYHTGGGETAASFDKIKLLHKFAKIQRITPNQVDEDMRAWLKEQHDKK